MVKRKYISPCVESIVLYDGEITTSNVIDFMGLSTDNELPWDWITQGNGSIELKGRIG